MAKPRTNVAVKATDEALDTLVQQFSQPLAFLRELVQNALDAGSNKVEVEIDYDAGENCARVQVTDWGEGMNREVIDSQLTRLFSSSKEGDLTRIGKFGIGFVSVFATRPRAVVVDTGRDGEYWRVLFHEDRTFERLVRHEPIEGTRVTSFIPLEKNKLKGFIADCRETVQFWCKHCDIEILVNGQPVNRPFELGLPGEVRLQVTGSEVVAAPSLEEKPFCGFYNRGLTLLEGKVSPRPGVTFKLRSVYLEHTLTRDNVVQDKHYNKAMAVLDKAISTLMPRAILEEIARRPDEPVLWELALKVLGPKVPADCLDIPVFPSHEGRLSFAQLAARRKVGYCDQSSQLVESLLSQNIAVLPNKSHVLALARKRVKPLPVDETWFLATPVDSEGALGDLLAMAARMLPGQKLQGASFDCCGHRGGQVSLPSSTPGQAEEFAGNKKLRLINVQHTLVQDLVRVVRHDAPLAAYLLSRAVQLESSGEPNDLLVSAFKLRRAR